MAQRIYVLHYHTIWYPQFPKLKKNKTHHLWYLSFLICFAMFKISIIYEKNPVTIIIKIDNKRIQYI